jgi:hypothetical protein
MMKYESPIWAEAKANRNIYVTDDLARAAEIKALDVHGLVRNVVPLYTAPPQREHIASEFKNILNVAEKRGAEAEREACASIEVHLTTPDRDYTNMSPLDVYEAALMDTSMAFRKSIRARGQHGD